MNNHDLIIVSSRLPFELHRKNHKWLKSPNTGAGGLGTAIYGWAKKSNKDVSWIGWDGFRKDISNYQKALNEASKTEPVKIFGIPLRGKVFFGYFRYANEVLWPLYHGFPEKCGFEHTEWYEFYKNVNKKFAETIILHANKSSTIWVHDYEFSFLAKYLRDFGFKGKILYFVHSPFPDPDIFNKLPQKKEVLRALLNYESIGFHTNKYKNNFINCIKANLPNTSVNEFNNQDIITNSGTRTVIKALPISIDIKEFDNLSNSKNTRQKTVRYLKKYSGKFVIFSAGREDYTKGFVESLKSYKRFLDSNPSVKGKVVYILVSAPTRRMLPIYQKLQNEIHSLVCQINSAYSKELPEWLPIIFIQRFLKTDELVAFYKITNLMLVNSLADGMNLVAKEFVACGPNNGILVLSKNTGAAEELKDAILVNPDNIDQNANILLNAYNSKDEVRTEKMKKMRIELMKNSINAWLSKNLE